MNKDLGAIVDSVQQGDISLNLPVAGAVNIKPLTIDQQRRLVSTASRGVHSGVYLANALNKIIKENVEDASQITILDRVPIAVALRFEAFGTVVKGVDYSGVDLSSDPFKPTNVISIRGLELEATIPTLETDTSINNHLIKVIEDDSDAVVSEVVGSMYVFETVRFLSRINDVDLQTFPVAARVEFVSKLPAAMNNKVLQYIKAVREKEQNFVTAPGVDKSIDIDASFFTP